jgi:hypothetical protein
VAAAGVPVSLDKRARLQLPFGLRVALGLDAGSRLLVVCGLADGSAAAVPVRRVAAAFGEA